MDRWYRLARPLLAASALALLLVPLCHGRAAAESSLPGAPVLGTANPASVYCRELGYEVEIVSTPEGERDVCVLPNGERCDAWEFYRGKVWPEYSWAARNGYRLETRQVSHGAYTTEEAVCIGADGSTVGTLYDLMNLEALVTPSTAAPPPAKIPEAALKSGARSKSLPSSFSWLDLGGCTPIKNQASCGSCWAFATVAPLECNILIHDSLTVDLSEQWLVSCNQEGYGCGGGWWCLDYFLDSTDPCRGTGAVLEQYFPYTATDAPCDCPYPHDYFVRSWALVDETVSIPEPDLIKQAIFDYGPVCVAVYVSSAFSAYNGGVFDEHATGSLNHGVALVGWDDSLGAEGAWILRNSWGPGWGLGGYMYIEYGCNLVGYEAAYVDYGCTETVHLAADGTGEYPTIGGALAGSSAECLTVIELEDGTYAGPGNRGLDVQGRRVTIRSASGNPDLCVIDCEDASRFAEASALARVTLTDLTIRNAASQTGDGGALHCAGASLALNRCRIEDSHAAGDGGAVYGEDAAISIDGATLAGNTADGEGGALYAAGPSAVQISNAFLLENAAGLRGGAVAVATSVDLGVLASEIRGNQTLGATDGRGGGLFLPGPANVEGCLISGNRSEGPGGGLHMTLPGGAYVTIQGCTVSGNAAPTGGGVSLEGGGTVLLDRGILLDNCAAGEGDEVYLGDGSPTFRIAASAADTTGIAGTGAVEWLWYNTTADPGFCSPEACGSAPTPAGDYHIKDVSPCAQENAPMGQMGALGVACTPAVHAVYPDGSGEFGTIQEAVEGVDPYDIIELADGVFAGEGNRDVQIYGKPVTLRSMSGNADACVIDCEGSGRAFFFHASGTPVSVLENVTIRDGRATDGAGLYCESASPAISGCVIHHCTADQSGGAIALVDASPSIERSTLVENAAPSGGGIACVSSSPTVENTIIALSSLGEAVACDAQSSPDLACADLFDNAAGDWVGCVAAEIGLDGNLSIDPLFWDVLAADYHLASNSPCVEAPGCGPVGALGRKFSGPRVWHVPADAPTIQAGIDSAWTGDGVVVACGRYAEHGIELKAGVTLRSETGEADCVVIDAEGAGRVLTCIDGDSTTVVEGITLTGGRASGFWPDDAGGGIYCQGASPRIRRCVFASNTATYGGGLAVKDGSPDLYGCTFSGNAASAGGGGAYLYHYSTLTAEDCIIVGSTQGEAVRCYFQSTAALTCSDLDGNAGGDWVGEIAAQYGVNGNLSSDPFFCDARGGNYHLAEDSPCAPGYSPSGCDRIGALGVGCQATAVAETGSRAPASFFLGAAVPNPFNPVTEIAYGIPGGQGPSRVTLTVFDVNGREVATLVDMDQGPGTYGAVWEGRDRSGVPAASGVYFYRLAWRGKSETGRMVLLK